MFQLSQMIKTPLQIFVEMLYTSGVDPGIYMGGGACTYCRGVCGPHFAWTCLY